MKFKYTPVVSISDSLLLPETFSDSKHLNSNQLIYWFHDIKSPLSFEEGEIMNVCAPLIYLFFPFILIPISYIFHSSEEGW